MVLAHARWQEPEVAAQFDDIEQQRDARTLGMWAFLATEVLFFGGLFLGYTAYRTAYPAAFAAASHETKYWFGTVNTGVLLTSSLFMALAVDAARNGRKKTLSFLLALTVLLGLAFLGIKGAEYYQEYREHLIPRVDWQWHGPHEPQAQLFFVFYWLMTALHGLHVTIGVCVIGYLLWRSLHGKYGQTHYLPVELVGLYWHFVDVVWVFLYPLIYLYGRAT